jgi:hypothetical protein
VNISHNGSVMLWEKKALVADCGGDAFESVVF